MLGRQVIGGLVGLVLSLSPASASAPNIPQAAECKTDEKNLYRHYAVVDTSTNEIKYVRMYHSPEMSCTIEYSVEFGFQMGDKHFIYFEKFGVRK